MPLPIDATELRRRAAALRGLARVIEELPLAELRRRAGPDTWVGPTADRCTAEMVALGRRCSGAADDLVRRARVLDRQADEVDVVTRLAGRI